jgi:formylglycine-generating enzyme required for sulfatase activity
MVRIPPGQFVMGSPANEKGHQDDEVAHLVTLTHPFEIGRYKVTQGLWQSVMGTNPSDKVSCGPDCPVETISWDEVQVFLSKLNSKYPGKGYRLPTEAEWEYSCRAGDPHARYGDVDSIAWYGGNSENTSHPVGQKQPNAWGLYDMIGNVYEYCQDCYGPYPKGSVADPQGPMSGSTRVRRGGSYTNITGRDFYYELTGSGFQERYYAEGKFLRAASRESHDPKAKNCITGFRLARSL